MNAIIAVLIALSPPAFWSAREAARLAQCTTNLRRIGLALNHYESVNRWFPLGGVSTNATVSPSIAPFFDGDWSNLAHLLPFAELRDEVSSLNFSIDYGEPTGA